jgi:hypothetical protein
MGIIGPSMAMEAATREETTAELARGLGGGQRHGGEVPHLGLERAGVRRERRQGAEPPPGGPGARRVRPPHRPERSRGGSSSAAAWRATPCCSSAIPANRFQELLGSRSVPRAWHLFLHLLHRGKLFPAGQEDEQARSASSLPAVNAYRSAKITS